MRSVRANARCILAAVPGLFASVGAFGGDALAQTQVIPLRSGNGGTVEADAGVRTLIGASDETAAAATAPFARVKKPDAESFRPLATDPAARWVGPGTDLGADRAVVSYAIPFTVNAGPISAADLILTLKSHGLADDGVVADLVLNHTHIGEVVLVANEAVQFATDDLAGLLAPDANWLSVELPHAGSGGLIFSGRITILRSTAPADPLSVAPAPELVDDTADLVVAESAGVCVGFACRPRGDLDSDHDVDGPDYALFTECFTGAGTTRPDDCEYADFDCNGKIDLGDAAYFQAAFTGSF